MSYAEVAAKGPKQTDAEKVPDAVPEIMHEDSGVHSLDSLNQSPHIQSIPSSYADQQLGEERAEEARREAVRVADTTSQEAKDFASRAEAELSRLEREAGKRYDEFSAQAKDQYAQWKATAEKQASAAKKEVKKDSKKAQQEAKKAGRWADENKGNPVVVGNAVVIAALGAALGIGAYNAHKQGTLTWKVAGAWAGVVGLFAVGDYYVSQFFFKKYPPKQ